MVLETAPRAPGLPETRSQCLRVWAVADATRIAQRSGSKKDIMSTIRLRDIIKVLRIKLDVAAHLSRRPTGAARPCHLVRARSECQRSGHTTTCDKFYLCRPDSHDMTRNTEACGRWIPLGVVEGPLR